jgi:hypothetical protein
MCRLQVWSSKLTVKENFRKSLMASNPHERTDYSKTLGELHVYAHGARPQTNLRLAVIAFNKDA